MPMDRSSSTGFSSLQETKAVVSIECLTGSSKAEEWNGEMPQTGDIVEELQMGGAAPVRAPFKNGRSGVQRLLHASFKRKETSILVRVRRGRDEFAELQACIVPCEPPPSGARKPTYTLRSIHDPNHAVGFVDKTEGECLALQGSRNSRVVCALSQAQLQDGYVSYPWEKKMKETLQVPNSSGFLSLLLLPKVSDRSASRYNDLEDTMARANAWLNASQASGVPIVFMNIQTEALLTKEYLISKSLVHMRPVHLAGHSLVASLPSDLDVKIWDRRISGETASSTVNAGSLSDLSNLANASLYGFEDYHGVDIGVVRAVRLWYAPIVGEISIEIKLREGDSRLGFGISRTEEGFIYVSSVDEDADDEAASTRSGLRELYREAVKSNKRLVISRLSNEKVLPWLVSPAGAVRCYDTISLSQKLSLHRHALRPILLHFFMWDRAVASHAEGISRPRTTSPQTLPLPQFERSPTLNLHPNDGPGSLLSRDTAGDLSFRFRDFGISTNWV